MIDSLYKRGAWLLGYRGVPFAVRGIFRFEVMHMTVWGVAWGCLNAKFCMYVARRSLDAPMAAVSLIAASTALANILAIWWGSLATRFERKRLLIASLGCVAVIMSSVTLAPRLTPRMTAWLFAFQLVLAWVAVQASNTVRTSLWRTNYPDHLRARILARFAIWQMAVGSLTVVFAGAYLDGALTLPLTRLRLDLAFLPGSHSPDAFRYVFLGGAASALLAAAIYRRVRVRGTRRGAQAAAVSLPGALAFSDAAPGWFATSVLGVRTGVREAFEVLRDDPAYRRYMGWQMLAGSANMITFVPIVLILDDYFEVSYVAAAGLLAMIPQLVIIAGTPYWARRFDRWDIARFRSVQMVISTAAFMLTALGVRQGSLALFGLSFALRGWAECAGRFAWQLGHMAFARPHKDALYMGVHQALTGLRGLTMPFLGAFLYRYLLDWHILWVAAVIQIVTAFGFARMGRAWRASPTSGRAAH